MRARVSFDSPAYKQRVRGGRNMVIALIVQRDDAPDLFRALQELPPSRVLQMELYAPEATNVTFEQFMATEIDEANKDAGDVIVEDG